MRNDLLADIVTASGGTLTDRNNRGLLLKDWLEAVQAPKFTPANIFSGGANGVWYDPSDLSTLFQDAGGTVPVVNDGDPVGLMIDKSGNGNNATQINSDTKPIYRTDGQSSWLEFDGINDSMLLNQFITGTKDRTFVAGYQDSKSFSEQSFLFDAGKRSNGSTGGYWGLSTEYDNFYVRVLGFKSFIPAPIDNKNVILVDWGLVYGSKVADTAARLNAQLMSELSSSDTTINTEVFTSSTLGANGAGLDNFKGKLFNVVITDSLLSDSDKVSVESYIAEKTGVTL